MEQAKEMAKLAVTALEEKKAEDVKVIDIRDVDEELYKAGYTAKQIEGNSYSTWILMDYGDIIVHVFSKEDRLFYDLERIWKDGKEISVADL